jgi:tetratricopeptide (TPR) repeat protein
MRFALPALAILQTGLLFVSCPQFLEAATTDSGSSKESLLKEIGSLTESHSYFKATALLDKLHKNSGNDIDVTLASARLYRDMGLLARAEAQYKHALALNPSCTESLVALSDMCLQGLDTRRALSYARQAYFANPHATDAQVALSTALIARGNLHEADQELSKLLQSNPNSAQIQHVAYTLAAKREQLPEAQRRLEEAIRLSPLRADWLIDLSELYKAQGEYGNCRHALEKALSIDSYSLEALNKLAQVDEFYLHDYDKAMDEYKNILSIDSDSVTALAGLDRCKVKKNDLAGALRFQLQNLSSATYSFFTKPHGD